MDPERRQYQRIPCYIIAHRPESGAEEDFFGIVRNIAAGGAMIETENALAVSDRIDLVFLTEEERQFWEGRGRVVWVRSQAGKIIFGMQFDEPLEPNWQNAFK